MPSPKIIEVGDILLTRNQNERDNSSPGYWNHSAIYVGRSQIVEAQIRPGAVILSDLVEFHGRYPQILYLRTPIDGAGLTMARHARKLLGGRYAKRASIFRNAKDKFDNCVTVIRKSWEAYNGADPSWFKPDDILNSGLFNVVGEKP